MSAFFISVSAVLAVAVLLVVVGLARRVPIAVPVARVVLPLAVIAMIAEMALRHWSLAAFALLAVMIVSAGALAVQGRDGAGTWIALGVFAVAGLAGGFGLLTHGLCLVGESYGCGGTGPDLLAVAGWGVAWIAYGYLWWGALRW